MAKALVQNAACQRGGPESGYPDRRPTPPKPSPRNSAKSQKKKGHRPRGVPFVEAKPGDQWPEAPEAPRPVSERTCCAANRPRSLVAWALRSRMENSQMPTKPMVIENRAGDV